MTFKTGRQYPIGGGSTLTLLGEQPFGNDILGPERRWREGRELHFLAHLVVEKPPLRNSMVDISRMHENVLLQELRTHDFIPKYEPKISSLGRVGGDEWWSRLIFRRCVEGHVGNAQSYCLALARKLRRCWEMVEVSEYLPVRGMINTRGHYPIRPHDILPIRNEYVKPGPRYLAARALIAAAVQNEDSWLPTTPSDMSHKISDGLDELGDRQLIERRRNGTYRFSERFVVGSWKHSIGEEGQDYQDLCLHL